MPKLTLLCCLPALWLSPVLAQDAAKPVSPAIERVVMNTGSFLGAHPDLRWRGKGLRALEKGDDVEALSNFKHAARYADKPSQAMIAEMLWTGRGVAVDRPLAYAWMDLAAECGYIPFLTKRERYWRELNAAQRTSALQLGQAVYAEYADAAAKPRLERMMRRALRRVTGSRTGFVGSLQVIVRGSGGMSMSGDKFYAPQFWQPEHYWAWQDSLWKDPRTGRVEVGPLQTLREDVDAKPETSPDATSSEP